MSRIIVIPDSAHPQLEGCPVLMNEEVRPEHLQDAHSADQLIERVAWAICYASDAEQKAVTYRGARAVTPPMTDPPSHPPLLTRRQLKRLETLLDDYKVVSARDAIPIVESPIGQTLSLQPNGRLAATTLIKRVQSNLHGQQG